MSVRMLVPSVRTRKNKNKNSHLRGHVSASVQTHLCTYFFPWGLEMRMGG
jgi:hypothetical protein